MTLATHTGRRDQLAAGSGASRSNHRSIPDTVRKLLLQLLLLLAAINDCMGGRAPAACLSGRRNSLPP